MICLAVQLVALGLTACTQAVSKAAAEQSAVPGDAKCTAGKHGTARAGND